MERVRTGRGTSARPRHRVVAIACDVRASIPSEVGTDLHGFSRNNDKRGLRAIMPEPSLQVFPHTLPDPKACLHDECLRRVLTGGAKSAFPPRRSLGTGDAV